MNWLPVLVRVESRIVTTVSKYWNGIYHHILMMYLSLHLDIPLSKTSTGQLALVCFGRKIWTKTSHSTKNVKTMAFYLHALKRKS